VIHQKEWRKTLVENDLYYFDEKAANRAVAFIERYCTHYETPFEGLAFALLDFQKTIVTDIFGWIRKSDGLRRFREAYIEMPKGNGKSPLMTAIGMYMFLAEGTAGAYVMSAATGYKQAQVTFDAAKRMVEQSPKLSKLCGKPLETKIRGPKNSLWEIVSGSPEGKAGPRPTCCLFDEAHEWPNRKMYAAMTKNAKKRPNSLIIVATNAGTRKDCVCWELHEKAQRVLDALSNDDTLYPVIYGSDSKDDPFDPELWKRVNPALDVIVSYETLASEAQKAKQDQFDEADFRRLNCGQWGVGASKWLDMNQWDACTRKFPTSEVKALPLVLALDMSLNDDLTALSFQWIGSKNIYIKCKFWLPRTTAQDYEQKDSIPFSEWANENRQLQHRPYITLVDSETIDPRCQQRIANFIIGLKSKYNLTCLTYDRNRASNVVALVEAAGIKCIPVPQNWVLSPAAEELTRRLKAREIVIMPCPITRWNASNVEATTDRNGNIHIIKEGRTTTGYKGRRGSKIDAIAAIVTGLTQVRLELMQPSKRPSIYETQGIFSV
jgi:phage terminase large subunit-like protein